MERNMQGTLEILVMRQLFTDSYPVLICQRDYKGTIKSVATSLIIEDRNIDVGKIIEPTFHLMPEQAQKLLDELWNTGLRPRDGTGNVGQVKVIENHLQDMRSLVFGVYQHNKELK